MIDNIYIYTLYIYIYCVYKYIKLDHIYVFNIMIGQGFPGPTGRWLLIKPQASKIWTTYPSV